MHTQDITANDCPSDETMAILVEWTLTGFTRSLTVTQRLAAEHLNDCRHCEAWFSRTLGNVVVERFKHLKED